MGSYRLPLVLGLGVMAVLALVIWFYPSPQDFRMENPFWNGLADFSRESQVSPLHSWDLLPSSPRGTTLITIPYLPFTRGELEKLEEYVSSGGNLIVMDDYGYGNDLLSYLGLEAKFSGKPMLDPLFNYRRGSLPKIVSLASVPATDGVTSLLLNHASTLEEVPEAEVIAWSSRFSFLDVNNSQKWDTGEFQGPFPVAAQFQRGEGRIYVIADPSMLVNSMWRQENNQRFIQNILGGSPSGILVDESHLPKGALDEAKEILRTVRLWMTTPLVTLALVGVVVTLTLRTLRRQKGEKFG